MVQTKSGRIKQGNLKLKLHTDNSQMSHFGKHPNINDLCKYLNAGASRNGHDVCILKCGLVGRNRGVYFFRNIHPCQVETEALHMICEGSQIVLAQRGNAESILKMTKRCITK